MDFVIVLTRTSHGSDNVWVIVDHLTKSALFILAHVLFNAERLVHIYIREIVHLYGMRMTIILDRGLMFTSHFWKTF